MIKFFTPEDIDIIDSILEGSMGLSWVDQACWQANTKLTYFCKIHGLLETFERNLKSDREISIQCDDFGGEDST